MKQKQKAFKIQLLADRVLAKRLDPETITKGGLIIPESVKEKPVQGIITHVGNGLMVKAKEIKVGDTIVFGKYSGQEVELHEEKYLIIRESEIFAVIETK